MAMNSFLARRRRYPVEPPVPLRQVPCITLNAFPALMLPVICCSVFMAASPRRPKAPPPPPSTPLCSTVLYRAVTWKQLYNAIHQREGLDIDRDADRGCDGIQLRGDH